MTAEEVLKPTMGFGGTMPAYSVQEAMRIFAKYHVQEALKEANRNAKIEHSEWESGHYWHHEISEDSILNAYPLENIK